jgi:1-acyl-sn-glycerol-3-phosphate acyltransferase
MAQPQPSYLGVACAAVRTLLWAPIFLLGTLCQLLAAACVRPFSERHFLRVVRSWGAWNRFCARWLLGQRVVVVGTPPVGSAFLLMKHESMFETIDLPYWLDQPVVFAKQELFRLPIWGRLAKAYGLVPIERSAGAAALRTMQRSAHAASIAGRPIVLFPEGTRVNHGECPSIRSGFAGVYKLLNMPVTPVALDSGRLIYAGWVRMPGTITYLVGEPIPPGLPRAEAEQRAYLAINALNLRPAD